MPNERRGVMPLYPHSTGTSMPRYRAPANACDSHVHIYDERFAFAWPDLRAVSNASVAEYRKIQERLGTTRTVVVQPAAYGTDNAVTLDALRQLGRDRARGVAVVHPSVKQAKLRTMHEAGVRGLRFTQYEPRTAVTTAEMIEPLAKRVRELGWHVQLHLRGDQIVAMAEMIERLPCTIVFDHMARLPQPQGLRHPALAIVKRLLDAGRTWVKISGAYLDSRTGSPTYSDLRPVAKALAEHAPERMVWGSDWPHPTERDTKPDDALLFDLLHEWVPHEPMRQRILVDNPARLYGF